MNYTVMGPQRSTGSRNEVAGELSGSVTAPCASVDGSLTPVCSLLQQDRQPSAGMNSLLSVSGVSLSSVFDGETPAETPLPPDSNTGVLTALVDWLSITFPDNVDDVALCLAEKGSGRLVGVDVVKSLFGLDGWVALERGDLGYMQGAVKGRIRLYWEGNAGTIHVRLSGQACRELEGAADFKGWQVFLSHVLRLGAHLTRCDVAMDDVQHMLSGGAARITMQEVQSCVDRGQVVSTYRKARGVWEKSLRDGAPVPSGDTIYFGSRKSDSMIRFYDKGKQMKMSESYVRVELELHDKQAQAMAQMIASGAHLGTVLAGVLRRKLDFKETHGHSQRERRKTLGWWVDFLEGVEKMRLGVAPVVRTLQKVKNYLMRQVAPSFALVCEIAERHPFGDFVKELRSEGLRRFGKWHIDQLAAALDQGVDVPMGGVYV